MYRYNDSIWYNKIHNIVTILIVHEHTLKEILECKKQLRIKYKFETLHFRPVINIKDEI